MDWTNTAHVLQGLYWTSLVLIFFNGYIVGSRAVVS